MPRLELQLLGPFRAALNGRPVTAQVIGKLRALLAYLAVESGRPHHRETLAGLLWSDQPTRKALHSLRQALSSLRKSLGDDDPPLLVFENETVCFELAAGDWLDVHVFERLVAAACRAAPLPGKGQRVNARLLRQACALYRGAFLDQLIVAGGPLFNDWAMLQRETLARKAVEALSALADYHERRGEYGQGRSQLARLLEIAPWDENAHCEQMRLLALDGQWSAAQAQFIACRRYLRDELGVSPSPETVQLFEIVRRGETNRPRLVPSLPPTPHTLPVPPTPFVGREAELAELHDLLANPQQRLVTLLGPGGIGKTRLALEAAREQVGLFPDGVHFVPLAALDEPQGLLPAIAEALGVIFSDRKDPATQLVDYLRSRELLLLLDNCEFLSAGDPPGAARLAELLCAAPGLVVLATSRQRLNLQEEILYQLDGLAYPRRLPASPPLEGYSAIDLFVRRARAVQRDFSLGEAEQAAVVRICQLLDGLPLGLELAAAALWTRSCAEVAEELDQDLDNLPEGAVDLPERHRSLGSACEFSWRLLAPDEQGLFARLSVLRGGFDANAAARVAGASPARLNALVDKSLLRRDASRRYEWHEVLRQFAAEKLAAEPEAAASAHARHARYFAALLADLHQNLSGPLQVQALDEVAVAFDNIHGAWNWLVSTGEYAEIERCADSLYQFCDGRSRFHEGLDLFARALACLPQRLAGGRVDGVLSARCGALRERVSDFERGRAALQRARAVLEPLGDPPELAFCLNALSGMAAQGGDYPAALQLARECLELQRRFGQEKDQARAMYMVAKIQYRLGQVQEARQMLEASLALGRATMSQRNLIGPLNVLADVFCHLGDYGQARKLFEEGLELSRSLGDQYNTALLLNNLGTLDHTLARYESAATLYQQSREICHAIGDRVGEAMALSNLGEAIGMLGDYTRACQATRQALEIARALQDPWTILACLNALGDMAFDHEDDATAWTEMRAAVRMEMEAQDLPMLMRSLVTLAGVCIRTGRTQLGLDVLAVALRHPACQEDCIRKGQRWLEETGRTLPEDVSPLDEVLARLEACDPPGGREMSAK